MERDDLHVKGVDVSAECGEHVTDHDEPSSFQERNTAERIRSRRKRRKGNSAPGVMAKEGGTTLKRGAATQVMTYPRKKTKKYLVRASRKAGESLSTFLIKAGIKRMSKVLRCKPEAVIPMDELRQYR